MTCREFADFMMDYLTGELPSESRVEFERHLQLCTNCERYLTSYRESVALGTRAFDYDSSTLPSNVPDDLVKAILAARRSN